MKISSLLPLAFLVSCSTSLPTDDSLVSSASTSLQEKVVWEDLRIQKLMPGYMIFPAIEPCLPDNFIGLSHPDPNKWNKLYWGTKEALEKYFQRVGGEPITLPIFYIEMSSSVAQKDDGSFTCENTVYEELAAEGYSDIKVNKWQWGTTRAISASFTAHGVKNYLAWIGLGVGGQVLVVSLFLPDEELFQEDASQLWENFLTKSRPLEEHDFYKVHGQDLREGFTLVNVYGSVLRVSAEKRIRDGKIQITIEPEDTQISCKCSNATQLLMEAPWHFFEPIVKIQAQIQVSSTANIIYDTTMTVLLTRVSEFSHNKELKDLSAFTCNAYGNISIINCCDGQIVSER